MCLCVPVCVCVCVCVLQLLCVEQKLCSTLLGGLEESSPTARLFACRCLSLLLAKVGASLHPDALNKIYPGRGTHTHTHTHRHRHRDTHRPACTRTPSTRSTQVHTQMHTHIHTQTRTHRHTHRWFHTNMHAHRRRQTHTRAQADALIVRQTPMQTKIPFSTERCEPHGRVCACACACACVRAPPPPPPELVKRLDDSSDQVRAVALKALGLWLSSLGEDYHPQLYGAHLEFLFQQLLLHLDDPDGSVQEQVLGESACGRGSRGLEAVP